RHQYAGNHTGHEQLADRGVRRDAIENHWPGRRYQDAEGAACGNCAISDARFISVAQHLGNGYGTNGQGSCHTGTGYRGENRASQDGRYSEPARQMTSEGVGGVVKIVHHLAAYHHMRHICKKRNGDQQVLVDLTEYYGRNRAQMTLISDE